MLHIQRTRAFLENLKQQIMFQLIFSTINIFVMIIKSQSCVYGDADLSFLQNTGTVTCSYDTYTIGYSACSNNVQCQCSHSTNSDCTQGGQLFTALETEMKDNIPWNCYFLVSNQVTNPNSEEIKNVGHGEAYVIQWTRGQSGRIFNLRLFCVEDTTFDQSKTSCNQQNDGITYNLDIYTSTICDIVPPIPTQSPSKNDNDLSVGWIFVICLVSVFVLYCVIGYIINGYKYKSWGDVSKNIPNYSLWVTLPKASIAGCIVSFNCIKSKFSKKTNY